jgi:hypothetical protein
MVAVSARIKPFQSKWSTNRCTSVDAPAGEDGEAEAITRKAIELDNVPG